MPHSDGLIQVEFLKGQAVPLQDYHASKVRLTYMGRVYLVEAAPWGVRLESVDGIPLNAVQLRNNLAYLYTDLSK